MRLYFGIAAILTVIATIDIVFYLMFLKNNVKKRWITISYFTLSILYITAWVILINNTPSQYKFEQPNNYYYYFTAFAYFMIIYLSRLIAIIIQLIITPITKLFKLSKKRTKTTSLLIGLLFLILSILGVTYYRYDFRIINQQVPIKNLPKSFNNFKIVQISDLHLGTAEQNYSPYIKFIKTINNLKPDIIVFTGDLVNNFASELEGWSPIFKTLKAKYGVYAILGNHDYGDYVKWASPLDKQLNFKQICSFYDSVNWHLLRNEYKTIKIQNDSIHISGVENWGLPPFPQYGDINIALPKDKQTPIILLSHDPSYWDKTIKTYSANIALTLSGHTHGFQIGVRSKILNISPASLKYKHWGGLYKENGKYIYVNVGDGSVGYPGRIGMRPEITVISLVPEKLIR